MEELQPTEEQRQILAETRPVETPDQFQALLTEAEPEFIDIFETNENEVQGPNQPIEDLLAELRDLYLSAKKYSDALAQKNFGPDRLALFRDSIRLLGTSHLWFGESTREGLYRPKPVEQVIEASRPWREEIKAIANQAFVRNRKLREQFADVNSTRTLEEEKQDLKDLNELIEKHKARLTPFGLTPELIARGQTLQEEAEGRDLIGVLKLRNREEALYLRNKILTYAVFMGEEARAAGINAFLRDPQKRRRFEAHSFRNALKKLQARRKSRSSEEEKAPEEAAAPTPPTEEASE